MADIHSVGRDEGVVVEDMTSQRGDDDAGMVDMQAHALGQQAFCASLFWSVRCLWVIFKEGNGKLDQAAAVAWAKKQYALLEPSRAIACSKMEKVH